MYFHDGERRNQRIGSIKSDKLTYDVRLCGYCNNERTQPYDRAWECLSKYLRERQPAVRPGMIIQLNRPFPGATRESMLRVHLYFLKLFGCMIVEHQIPIDIDQFSHSLMHELPHPNVWLRFETGLIDRTQLKHVWRSQVETAQLGGRVSFATWYYAVDHLAVNVMYAIPGEMRHGLVKAWHPASSGKHIRILRP